MTALLRLRTAIESSKDPLVAFLRMAAEINAETVRSQQQEIARLQGLLAEAGIDYEETE